MRYFVRRLGIVFLDSNPGWRRATLPPGPLYLSPSGTGADATARGTDKKEHPVSEKICSCIRFSPLLTRGLLHSCFFPAWKKNLDLIKQMR